MNEHSGKKSLRRGRWTNDEVELLRSNANTFMRNNGLTVLHEFVIDKKFKKLRQSSRFFDEIGLGINRSRADIYKKARRELDTLNHRGQYSEDEIKKLHEAVNSKFTDGFNNWDGIRQEFDRSALSLARKARKIVNRINVGPWSNEEMQKLSDAVHFSTGTERGQAIFKTIHWRTISDAVGTRSEDQCRLKWLLDGCFREQERSRKCQRWTAENDILLLKLLYPYADECEQDVDWEGIYDKIECAKSPTDIRTRWYLLKRKIPSYQYKTFQEQYYYLYNEHADELKAIKENSSK